MHQPRLIAFFAVALIGLLIAAGCGDGGDDAASRAADNPPADKNQEGNTAPDGTAPEGDGAGDAASGDGAGNDGGSADAPAVASIERANSACAQSANKIRQDMAPFFKERDDGAVPRIWAAEVVNQVVVPGFGAQARMLRALDASGTEAGQLNAVAAEIQAMVREAKADPLAYIKQKYPFIEVEKVADKYGLTACGRL